MDGSSRILTIVDSWSVDELRQGPRLRAATARRDCERGWLGAPRPSTGGARPPRGGRGRLSRVERRLVEHLDGHDSVIREGLDPGVADARSGVAVPARGAGVLTMCRRRDPLLDLGHEGRAEPLVVVDHDVVVAPQRIGPYDLLLVAERDRAELGDELAADVVAILTVDEHLVVHPDTRRRTQHQDQ